MKIILATDFSDANKTLSEYAIDLLKDKEGTLLLFHAYESPEDYDEAEAKMSSTVNLLSDFGNINVKSVLVQGDPETCLLNLIDTEKADLVLMSTRGRGNKGFLEGSLSKKIMSSSPIPLLSIHEDYQYRDSSEILFVTNFNKSDIDTIKKIFDLLEPFNPNLHIVHCLIDGDPGKASRLLTELESSLNKLNFSKNIRYKLIFSTDPKVALKTYCNENNISLVAFTPREKHFDDLFFKDRVTKNDFYNLHLPLLTFKKQS